MSGFGPDSNVLVRPVAEVPGQNVAVVVLVCRRQIWNSERIRELDFAHHTTRIKTTLRAASLCRKSHPRLQGGQGFLSCQCG